MPLNCHCRQDRATARSGGEGTFGGTRNNGEVAPKPAVPGTLVVRLKSTRLGHSAFALGMALLPHLEGLFQASAWYDGSTSTAMVKDI